MLRGGSYFGVSVAYLIGKTDDPTATEDEIAVWEGEDIVELETLSNQLCQSSYESLRIVGAVIREAYQLDRELERLKKEHVVTVRSKKTTMNVAE